MTNRKIYRQSDQWLVREQGTSRNIAVVPCGGAFESLKSSEAIAKEIQLLPELLSYLEHRSFHGDADAAKLLKELT